MKNAWNPVPMTTRVNMNAILSFQSVFTIARVIADVQVDVTVKLVLI